MVLRKNQIENRVCLLVLNNGTTYDILKLNGKLTICEVWDGEYISVGIFNREEMDSLVKEIDTYGILDTDGAVPNPEPDTICEMFGWNPNQMSADAHNANLPVHKKKPIFKCINKHCNHVETFHTEYCPECERKSMPLNRRV